VAVYFLWSTREPSPTVAPSSKIMLAVLPFDNLTGDEKQEYLSDGMTEEMITQLGVLSPVRMGVIARTSSMSYKKTQKTIDQIGHELGVDYVLEGSLRQEAGQIRVTAQLIQVKDQTHLWADNFDGSMNGGHLLAAQTNIAKRIAGSLSIALLANGNVHE